MLAFLGGLILVVGLLCLIVGLMNRAKAGRVADAPLVSTGDAASRGAAGAGPKGAISVQGAVSCPEPLTAPFTGEPCLYWAVKVVAEWKEGDTNRTKELQAEKRAAAFGLDDGSGVVPIQAGKGGDFEPMKHVRETKGTGLGAILAGEVTFGNLRIPTGKFPGGTKFTLTEDIVPLTPRLYACGKTVGGGIEEPGWRSLLLSDKNRDDLLAAATKGAKQFFVGGGIASAVGALGLVIGLATAPAPAKAAPTVATPASTNATAPAVEHPTPATPVATTVPTPSAKTPAPKTPASAKTPAKK